MVDQHQSIHLYSWNNGAVSSAVKVSHLQLLFGLLIRLWVFFQVNYLTCLLYRFSVLFPHLLFKSIFKKNKKKKQRKYLSVTHWQPAGVFMTSVCKVTLLTTNKTSGVQMWVSASSARSHGKFTSTQKQMFRCPKKEPDHVDSTRTSTKTTTRDLNHF